MASDNEPEPVEERTGRGMDPEILLLSRIARQLDDLEPEAQARVIAYLADRYRRSNA